MRYHRTVDSRSNLTALFRNNTVSACGFRAPRSPPRSSHSTQDNRLLRKLYYRGELLRRYGARILMYWRVHSGSALRVASHFSPCSEFPKKSNELRKQVYEQIAKLQFYAISNKYTFIPVTLGIVSRKNGILKGATYA